MAAVPGVLRKWTPGLVPGLCLWLDAGDSSTLTLNGSSNVSQIADKSGLPGQNLVQNIQSHQPYIGSNLNGRQTLTFNTGLYMSTMTTNFPTSLNSNSFSYFVTNVFRSTGNSQLFLMSNATNPTNYYYINNNALALRVGFKEANDSGIIYIQCPSGTSNFIIETFSGPSLNVIKVVNSNVISDTQTTQAPPYPTNMTSFTIGSQPLPFLGDMGEILAFNNNYYQNTQYTPQLEGYLAWKWGMTNYLSSNHPYKNRPPI